MRLRQAFENVMDYEISRDRDGISLLISDIVIPMVRVAPIAVLLFSAVHFYAQSEQGQFKVQDEFSTPVKPRP